LPQQGTHQIRFLDGNGTSLRAIAWTPDFRDDDSPEPLMSRPFTWYVEPIEGVKKVVLLNRDRIIDTLVVPMRGPVIDNLHQDAPRVAAAAADAPGAANVMKVRLSWDASHPDADAVRGLDDAAEGDKLLHQVYYSNDGGKTWRLVASGLSQPAADLDVSSLPGGGEGRFQIRTTDGYNVTKKTSNAVTLADRPPTAEIVAPRSGNAYAQGAGVLLIGRGFDAEDGALVDDRHKWQSDLQGELGTGKKLVVRNLRVGTHQITLSVRDSKGNPGTSAPVEVRVRAR
jgi:hypothetical protein